MPADVAEMTHPRAAEEVWPAGRSELPWEMRCGKSRGHIVAKSTICAKTCGHSPRV